MGMDGMTQIIVFMIFGGFGLMMLYVGATQFIQQRRLLRHAQPIEVVITHASVFSGTSSNTDTRLLRSNSTTTHRPELRFRYRLKGREYESDLLHPTSIAVTYASREAAAEVLAPYPLNAKVRALVNPAMPDKAFLDGTAGAGPVIFMVLGTTLPPLAWFIGAMI